ncbi:hypothetical protein FQR65_LT04077 [Abscondita terminalis]|nr:hypothetical protein FQR65_LT04077 [Abscondita terminalis]
MNLTNDNNLRIAYLCPTVPKLLCSWEGNAIDMLEHILYAHDDILLESNSFTIDILCDNDKKYIMASDSGIFLVQIKTRIDHRTVYLQLRFLTYDNSDTKFLRYGVEASCGAVGFTNESETGNYNPVHNFKTGVKIDLKTIDVITGYKVQKIVIKINLYNEFKEIIQCLRRKDLHFKAVEEENENNSLNTNSPLEVDDNFPSCGMSEFGENDENLTEEDKTEAVNCDFFSEHMLHCVNCGCNMIPPIHICPNDHNVCYACRSSACNVCNESITNIRNIQLEEYSKTLKHRCRYELQGCSELCSYSEIRKHELQCVYCIYKCELCKFQGKLVEIETHFRMAHPSTKIYQTMSGIHFRKGSNFIILNNLGVFYCKSSATDIYIKWEVIYCGPKERLFSCEVKVSGKKQNQPPKRYFLRKVENVYSDMKMLKLKPSLLQKLKCVRCDGYLRVAPVMITSDKCQICGKCFKILPLKDKEKCVRLEAYEAVAEMLLFPCRYSVEGCQFQFSFNEVNNHELECSYRFNASNDIEEVMYEDVSFYDHKGYVNVVESANDANYDYCDNSQLKFVISDIAQNVNVESNFLLKYNRTSNVPSLLKYNMHVIGKSGTFLQLSNKQLNDYAKSPVKITIDGEISLTSVQAIFSNVTISDYPLPNSVYSRNQIPNVINKRQSFAGYPKCVKCSESVKHEIYHCTFGHNVCNTCKANKCTLCTTPISSVPRYYCKNFGRGCPVYLLYTELYLHLKDCEFGNFSCPLEDQCDEKLETLLKLKEHLKANHAISDTNLVSKQSSKKDDLWIILSFNSIFKCKFFYYESEIEFVVELVGSHKNSEKFKYEITIESKQKNVANIVRTSKCVNWKSSVLEQCVKITKKELQAIKTNIEGFTYTLNILETKIYARPNIKLSVVEAAKLEVLQIQKQLLEAEMKHKEKLWNLELNQQEKLFEVRLRHMEESHKLDLEHKKQYNDAQIKKCNYS